MLILPKHSLFTGSQYTKVKQDQKMKLKTNNSTQQKITDAGIKHLY